jgi:hypothetical protein
MQKLSKGLVKKLIYESIEKNKARLISVSGEEKTYEITDPKGERVDTRVLDSEELKSYNLTKESIKRIIREEVQAYYGAE